MVQYPLAFGLEALFCHSVVSTWAVLCLIKTYESLKCIYNALAVKYYVVENTVQLTQASLLCKISVGVYVIDYFKNFHQRQTHSTANRIKWSRHLKTMNLYRCFDSDLIEIHSWMSSWQWMHMVWGHTCDKSLPEAKIIPFTELQWVKSYYTST